MTEKEQNSLEIERRCTVALERLLAINWENRRVYDDPSIMPSCVTLASEFVRRINLWQPPVGHPIYIDLATHIAPSVCAPILVLELAKQKLQTARMPKRLESICLNYLKWIVVEQIDVVQQKLSDKLVPYEPAIRLFERGGDLFLHNGAIFVGGASFYPRPTFQGDLLRDLSDEALDQIDKREALNW